MSLSGVGGTLAGEEEADLDSSLYMGGVEGRLTEATASILATDMRRLVASSFSAWDMPPPL
jgi:hypothetical protein